MTLLDRLQYDFWVTADRRFYYFHEMSDSHLDNTIRLLLRQSVYLQFQADEDDGTHPINWLAKQPAFKGLVREKRRRARARKIKKRMDFSKHEDYGSCFSCKYTENPLSEAPCKDCKHVFMGEFDPWFPQEE